MCQNFNNRDTEMPRRLPTVTYKGKKYYIDWRLQEFRPVAPPIDFIPFDSELGREIDEMPEPEKDSDLASKCIFIECPACRKVLFKGTKEEVRQHVIYCADCSSIKDT